MDDEILQDFLVEAGEILEDLSAQLVDLEARSNDANLLNAIFRGFHTVKGGAGFLALTALVDVCHIAENVFDILRQGKRKVDATLMDVILKALDTINAMFEEVRNSHPITPADPELLHRLEELCHLDGIPEEPPPPVVAAVVPAAPVEIASTPIPTPAPMAKAVAETVSGTEEISDADFEKLLDALHGEAPVPPPPPVVASAPPAPKGSSILNSDVISDEDFERLLDELQGVPPKPASPATVTPAAVTPAAAAPPPVTPAVAKTASTPAVPKPPTVAPAIAKTPVPAAAPPPSPPPAATKAPEPPAEKHAVEKGEKESPAIETTVRVDTSRLDDIMNMVGELVLVRNRLVTLGGNSADEVMSKAVANLDVVTADLQMAVMKTRMQPIKKVFGRFPRVVRDLARVLKKEISLELLGEETDLDKNLVEALADPLVHLVRNSVDHGIEMPDARAASGKPRQGTIILSAEQAGDHILLKIIDDGNGMDPDFLRKKVVQKGLMDEDTAARMSEQECFNVIFLPGFSTKDQISDISGRGVGMDVVKTKIAQLNGMIAIDSQAGKGTKISIKVPLTLAILPTLMVIVGEQTFALPLTSVSEIFHLDLTKTNVVDGQMVVLVRDKAIPLFHLGQWLLTDYSKRKKESQGHVVIVTVSNVRVGFVVEGLLGQEEVVIKPLGDMLQGTPGMAGATITGDGKIAMILDVPGLLKRYARKAA